MLITYVHKKKILSIKISLFLYDCSRVFLSFGKSISRLPLSSSTCINTPTETRAVSFILEKQGISSAALILQSPDPTDPLFGFGAIRANDHPEFIKWQ